MKMAAKAKLDSMGRPAKETDKTTFRGRVGALLRKHREAKGYSLQDLADRLSTAGLNLGVASLSAYEVGRQPLQIDTLPTFAKVLGVTPKDFIPAK